MKTYLLIINALAFMLMFLDKQFARRHQWRIPEATLLGCAVLGGSLGELLGMYLCRHKTKHPKFYITVPVLLVLQAAALYWFYFRK